MLDPHLGCIECNVHFDHSPLFLLEVTQKDANLRPFTGLSHSCCVVVYHAKIVAIVHGDNCVYRTFIEIFLTMYLITRNTH